MKQHQGTHFADSGPTIRYLLYLVLKVSGKMLFLLAVQERLYSQLYSVYTCISVWLTTDFLCGMASLESPYMDMFHHSVNMFSHDLYNNLHYSGEGTFGPCVLSLHKPFLLPTSIVVDDLHCIYLGVTKTILHLWMESKNRSAAFYIGKKVSQC